MNTYKNNPTRGLSKLQKEILNWLSAECQEHSWARPAYRPKNLQQLTNGDRDENGELVFFGPSDASFCRAIKSLVKRRLVEKDQHRDHNGALRLRLTENTKLLISEVNSFQPATLPHTDPAPISPPKGDLKP